MVSLLLRAVDYLKMIFIRSLSFHLRGGASFYKKPIHLRDSELVQIMRLCFSQQFEIGPSRNGAEVSLKFRKSLDNVLQIEFWFTVSTDSNLRNYTGFITHYDNFLTISPGVIVSDSFMDDWGASFHVSMGLLNDYAGEISYFLKGKKLPEVNPTFIKEGWQQIYHYNYKTKSQIHDKESFASPR